MAPKSRKRNASDAPSSSQRPNTPPEPTFDATRDIGEPFAQWKLDNKGKPSQIKRRELNPTARSWFDFVRRSLIPSSNNSEVIVERAVLIHSIIEGLDIKAELLITENISAAAECKDQAKRLPFPSIIYRLLYANGIKKIDGDKLIPIETPITTESMTKNKYLEIQQEI
ncbi:hypothetical protein PIB30_082432 [Stylosanthes scabra]|uniref:Putative plant transposon protein domain-containing protein n=1 Tax=Stylosanthes scabra TaxID=79078 RepID=A0ABU6XS31_9FABA|nr:hypothetical protein [Stylosanthes scabra]